MAVQLHAHPRPAFLHTGAPAALLGEQRDGLHEHARMRPLAMAHAGVDDEEQADRRAKEFVVVHEPLDARGAIFLRDANLVVHHLAHALAPRVINRIDQLEVGIDRTVARNRAHRIGRQHALGHRDDLVLGFTRHRDHFPGLQVPARR